MVRALDAQDQGAEVYSEEEMLEIVTQIDLMRELASSLDGSNQYLLDVIENICEKMLCFPFAKRQLRRIVDMILEACIGLKSGYVAFDKGVAELGNALDAASACLNGESAPGDGARLIMDERSLDAVFDEPAPDRFPVQEMPEAAREQLPQIDPDYDFSDIEVSLPPIGIDPSNPELADFITETAEYFENMEASLIGLEQNPDDMALVNEVFRNMHNIKGISGFLHVKDMSEIAHNAESLLDIARRGDVGFGGAIATISFETVDILKEMHSRIRSAVEGTPYEIPTKYIQVMQKLKGLYGLYSGRPVTSVKSPETVKFPVVRPAAQSEVSRPIAVKVKPASQVVGAPPVSGKQSPGACKKAAPKVEDMIKVSVTRLDSLIDAVGELVIANAMITREVEEREDPTSQLAQNSSQLANITRELQELAMGMRMVALKATFMKMARVARDTAAKSGVSVEFDYSGEDTEIDRNVVEEISSPLIHMIRNAIDHGIESPDERVRMGKAPVGRVHLSAYHEGGNVVIRIEDDGKGIDREKVSAKAIRMGIVESANDLSDREIHNLIFHPGFSTAEKVTDVSGRGVGMDVVKQSIENLRGRVEIQTESGAGTSFIIRLPLTLAIIDGMVIMSGGESYIIPTTAIQESLRPTREDILTAARKGEMITVRGTLIPLFRLDKILEIENAKTDPTQGLVLIMGDDSDRFALAVDDLVGQQQVVIKAFGKIIGRPAGISGGAIMGDGRVALILDVTGIHRIAHEYS